MEGTRIPPFTALFFVGVGTSVGDPLSIVGLSMSTPSLPAAAITAKPLPCAYLIDRVAASRPAACSGSVGLQYTHGSIEYELFTTSTPWLAAHMNAHVTYSG